MKLLNLQRAAPQAGTTDWRAWWRAFTPPLDTDAQPLYHQQLARLQRDLLLLLIVLTVPLGALYSVQMGYAAFVEQRSSVASFAVNTAQIAVSLLCTIVLMRSGKLVAAWGSIVALSLIATFLQIVILRNPGLLLFTLLNLTGLALFAPARATTALVAGLLAALWALMHALGLGNDADWFNIASLFAAIMVVMICIGVVVRRVAAQFAQATVAAQREAVERSRMEQRIADLRQHAEQIASLEHDVRQPLRTAQGYLGTLAAEQPHTIDLVLPALAAAQRTDRLLSNLLDQARAEAQHPPRLPQPVNLYDLFRTIEHTAHGLARYHTDPPVPVQLTLVEPLPVLAVDAEQIERAVLNLIDNALVHSPPNSTVTLHVAAVDHELQIDVCDEGPGLPADVRFALALGVPTAGLRLGLQQVQRTAAAHGGRLDADTGAHGTTMRIVVPIS